MKKMNLKSKTFRELIEAVNFSDTQKELLSIYGELKTRPFWMQGTKV